MASKTNWFENALNNYGFRGSATPYPGTAYLGLWTQALSDTSTGSSAGEVTGGGYARQPLVRGATDWDLGAGGTIKNTNVIDFGTATADWGTVTDFGLCDALTTGNMLYWGTVTVSKIVVTNDSLTFPAGSAIFTED